MYDIGLQLLWVCAMTRMCSITQTDATSTIALCAIVAYMYVTWLVKLQHHNLFDFP